MTYMLVRHKVEDYEKWKSVFDEHAALREEYGSKGGRLFKNVDSPNETIIVFKWDTVENARKFADSEDLKNAMKKAGVVEKPEIYFIEQVEKLAV